MKRPEQHQRIERFLKEKFPSGLPVIDENQFKELLAEYRKYQLPGEAMMDKILKGTKRGFWGVMDRFFRQIHFSWTFSRSRIRHIFLEEVRHQPAVDAAINLVKEDIEFWYDREMIYGKIMSGSYDNTPYSEKHDWFKRHDLDWKLMEKKSKIGAELSTAMKSEEFRKLVDTYALITIDPGEKERAFDEIRNFIVLHRGKTA